MNTDILQSHCDSIIQLLEKAVQQAVYARHFPTDNPVAAVHQAKQDYLQAVKFLYNPKDVPPIYARIYDEAIVAPYGYDVSGDSSGYERKRIGYCINARPIVRQLNQDFLPNQPRDFWVSYRQPHTDFSGKVSKEWVGEEPNYKMVWLTGPADDFEDNTVYLHVDQTSKAVTYTLIDPKGEVKTGDISFHEVLSLSLKDPQFINPEEEFVYAEIEINQGKVVLKNTLPFSDLKEENQRTMPLQETSTAIINRLIDAVYAAIYAEHLNKSVSGHNDALERYNFYMNTVKRIYPSNTTVPKIFDMIYKNAIDHPTYSITNPDYELLRYPIKVGCILTQLNLDFVSTNSPQLVYDKPYLGFRGQTLCEPLGGNCYQPLSFNTQADGLSYHVRDPQGLIKTGKLTLCHILQFLQDKGQILSGEDSIYVFAETVYNLTEYLTNFLMLILSHPITEFVAIALWVIGAALAYSGIALGVGITMAAVGGGLLVAGFFAPKNRQEDGLEVTRVNRPENKEPGSDMLALC